MNRNEGKLRARLARAKGGHRKVLQGKLDAMTAGRDPVVETVVPQVVKKKKSTKKKKS